MQAIASTLSPSSISSPDRAIEFYETEIASDETIASNYWQLGVAYLLAGREDDAHVAWFTPISTATADSIDDLNAELIAVLEREARYQVEISAPEKAWLLRQHIQILAPNFVENVFEAIYLAYLTENLTPDLLIEWQVLELIKKVEPGSIDDDLLANALKSFTIVRTDLGLKAIEACLPLTGSKREAIVAMLVVIGQGLFDRLYLGPFVVALLEICNRVVPDNLIVLRLSTYVHTKIGKYNIAIAFAEEYCRLASTTIDKLFGNYIAQDAYFGAGDWQAAKVKSDLYCELIEKAIESDSLGLNRDRASHLILSSFFLPYIADNPRGNKNLQNKIAAIYQQNIQLTPSNIQVDKSSIPKKTGCLRIGYIASTFRQHSVGWLSRWLMHHHDRESFQVFIYCVNTDPENSFNHQWFRNKVDIASYFGYDYQDIVAQIRADEIDILIELDSITFDATCMVMTEKPAPIQVSWLGWDASGLPAIDYFIADPYVLPDEAQEYYQEKIWRLPQTYLAVDGFEIGTPDLRRQDLDIPDDAVIYFSGQSGYKRNPDCIRAQMEIVKSVPNSYFLIKGSSDPEIIKNLFGKLAAEVGISFDRLKFIDRVEDEPTHRANLAIADVVLDTFPYNGATTTLETLWMGIPMVTQVGKQFSARNSYTFMLNAGIEEGIAWSQQEYIEWGIKLGLDPKLRMEIREKLRAGRQAAPVWDAQQFTRDMEQAYREMWAKYQAENNSTTSDRAENN
jgi:predicted O-linked N-acetylglucosamine transferase (SPINDLY family)